MDTIVRDIRIGLRVLAKERAFCALAVLVLALGICGVATMFAVVNGVMIKGFSFPNAGRLAYVNFVDPATGIGLRANGRMSSMDFAEFAAEHATLRELSSISIEEHIDPRIFQLRPTPLSLSASSEAAAE